MTTKDEVDAEKMLEAAGWLPCPLCGAELIQAEFHPDHWHPWDDECPLSASYYPQALRDGWNRRALTIPNSNPLVDVNETGFCEHQTGLVLTGERKADMSAGALAKIRDVKC